MRKLLAGLITAGKREAAGRISADKHWFAAETDLMQQQAIHDGTVWARETQDSLSRGTRAHAAHNDARSTGQELDNLAQRAQHTVSTGESLSVQTERLSVQADVHETLYQKRTFDDAAAREERLNAKADASAGKQRQPSRGTRRSSAASLPRETPPAGVSWRRQGFHRFASPPLTCSGTAT